MTFDDYAKLEKQAEEVGIGDDPCLIQLLHFLQFKEVVRRHQGSCMSELYAWEKNIALDLERRIKEASE